LKGIPIAVSFDRTVYPLDSIMHIRFRVFDLIPDELIHMQIIDNNKKIITSRTINPYKTHNLENSPNYLFQTDVKMKGNVWKLGHNYTVIAKYFNFEISSSTIIAKRRPVIQTDKSVYINGSDVILTVIAPDLDKDNQKAEIIGNSPDNMIIISSSHGMIKGYKLLETGDSTGIFQGVLQLAPLHALKKGKRMKNVAKGTGPFDGQLPVSIGEEILIEFKSNSGNEKFSIFSSNFGVAIELDQKVYVPTDKVYLTIVAPDFNFDSNKADVIGNRRDCKVNISTKKGKLSNYKLVETGKDSGIFTGEIILTSSKNDFPENIKKIPKNIGITKGGGPVNGKLACGKDDTLTVEMITEYEKYVGSAIIRYNIGEIEWDDEHYSSPSSARIRVIDPDMNLNPEKIDVVKIRVWSDTDLEGIDVELSETNEATGIFEGVVLLDKKISGNNHLQISTGDNIFAKYVDWSLPSNIKKSDLDIIATAKIDFEQLQKTVKILPKSSIPHDGKYLEPEIITIKKGTTIRWTNNDNAAHTITSGTPYVGPDGDFDSSLFISNEKFEHVFDKAGVFEYFCMIHPWKIGKIIVK
jgi:plastocyanin